MYEMPNLVFTSELETHGVKVSKDEDRSTGKWGRPSRDIRRVRCPLRLGIADDHAIVREGIKGVLAALPDIEVVGEACDGREAIELARRVVMDVLLMDLAMPKKGGLDALGSLRAQCPRLSVLIVSGFPEERFALALFRLGDAGFIAKDATLEEMIGAIRTVGSGKPFWGPSVTSMLASQLPKHAPAQLHDALTSREFQIFCDWVEVKLWGPWGEAWASHTRLSPHTVPG